MRIASTLTWALIAALVLAIALPLIFVGTLILASNLGWIDGGLSMLFSIWWPAILVIAGIFMIFCIMAIGIFMLLKRKR